MQPPVQGLADNFVTASSDEALRATFIAAADRLARAAPLVRCLHLCAAPRLCLLLSFASARTLALAWPGQVVVSFGAAWCAKCAQAASTFVSLSLEVRRAVARASGPLARL